MRILVLIIVVFFMPLSFFTSIAAVAERIATEPDCEVRDPFVAQFIGKPWNESPSFSLAGAGKVWFAARIERNGGVPCGFIYSYLVRNIGETDVFASWELPFRIPHLISVPVRSERQFSFSRIGAPASKTARARVFVRTANGWNDDPVPKREKLPADEIFWDWGLTAAGNIGIFLPKKLVR